MTTGRINQLAFLTDGPAPHAPGGKRGHGRRPQRATRVVHSSKAGAGRPHARRVLRIRENERQPRADFPRDAPRACGERITTGASRPTPRRVPRRVAPQGGESNIRTPTAIDTGTQHKKPTPSGTIADPKRRGEHGTSSLPEQGSDVPSLANRHSRALPHASPGRTLPRPPATTPVGIAMSSREHARPNEARRARNRPGTALGGRRTATRSTGACPTSYRQSACVPPTRRTHDFNRRANRRVGRTQRFPTICLRAPDASNARLQPTHENGTTDNRYEHPTSRTHASQQTIPTGRIPTQPTTDTSSPTSRTHASQQTIPTVRRVGRGQPRRPPGARPRGPTPERYIPRVHEGAVGATRYETDAPWQARRAPLRPTSTPCGAPERKSSSRQAHVRALGRTPDAPTGFPAAYATRARQVGRAAVQLLVVIPRLPSVSPSQRSRLAVHAQRPRGHRERSARHVGRSNSSSRFTPSDPRQTAAVPSRRLHVAPRTPTRTVGQPSNYWSSYPAPQRLALAADTPRRAPPSPLRASG